MWKNGISKSGFSSRTWVDDEVKCTGKWLVTFPLGDPDGLWDRLAEAAKRGDLTATKMSGPRLDAIVGHHIACVYCVSSQRDVVEQTLRTLRELGVEGPLHYKSDKATVEGREEYLWTAEQIETDRINLSM